MASEKALYWMAVGVLALIVGNHFVSKYSGECARERALASVRCLSSEATHSLAMAEVMLARTSLPWASSENAMARVQTRLASMQTVVARQEAACARIETQRAMQEMQQMRLQVICPRQNVRVEIPRIEVPRIEIPQPRVIPSDDTI